MRETNPTRYAVLRSGFAYGLGFVIGTLFILILFNNQVARTLTAVLLGPLQIFLRLVFGIVLVILIFGLGGGIAGIIGGYYAWTPRHEDIVEDRRRQRQFMWRSGWSFFIAHTILILPLVIITAIVGLLNPDLDVRIAKLPSLFLVYGLLYGIVAGLLLGWLAAGLRQIVGVWLAAIAGFGLGGILFGFGIQLLSRLQQPGTAVNWLVILVAIFFFGAMGGGALGFAFQYVHEHKSLFPMSRGWRILRKAALVVVALIFLSAIGRLVTTLTIRPASLAEQLVLPTQGTHWRPAAAPLPEGGSNFDNGHTLQATCSQGNQIIVTADGENIGQMDTPSCLLNPVIAADADGTLHVIWYSDRATKVTGVLTPGDFFYESINNGNHWTEPTIVARPDDQAQPALTAVTDNTLGLSWEDASGPQQAIWINYNCEDVPLTKIGEAVFKAVRQEKFRSTSDSIPYCGNTFQQLLYTPNPTAPDNTGPQNPDGAFDEVANLVETAQYEVLFVNMQWDAPSDKGSPGSTLALALKDLHDKVEANPENYPRGMTVRILLGNLPDLAIFDPTTQIYHVMQDLYTAGVTELTNEEIGWKLEIADFDGAWPHAHSKFIVVDGKTAVAAGFNYSYLHLPKDHPSGKGLDMNDKGLQVTGPMAQSVLAAYDDLWSGSDLYDCSRFPPPIPILDFLWCRVHAAKVSHPPEVLRFFPTDGNANAFALDHTSAHLESDEAILSALQAAEETIDLHQVNFSLETVCVAAILLAGLCDVEEMAPPYMYALLQAAVENDVKIRAIVEPSAFNGFENRMGIIWLTNRLAEAGKLENLEIKFSKNKMHDKNILIDNEMLIVGSQNFHWSAWDTPSLTEYNIATEAPEAISDFKQEYEYQWNIGTPAQDLMPNLSDGR